MSAERRTDVKMLRNLKGIRIPAMFAVAAILSGALMSPAAMAQEEKAVENFPTVLQREITLWSDGTRLSGVLLYPKDREEAEKLPAIVLCNGWGGTKAFLMRSGIAPRFAAAGYVVINYDYRGWGDSDSRLVVRDDMPRPDEDGYVTVKAQAIREVVDPVDQQKDIDAAVSYVYGEPLVDKDQGPHRHLGYEFRRRTCDLSGGARSSHCMRGRASRVHAR